MTEILIADERAKLLPDKALWLPERRALLLADLHFEKGSFLRAAGNIGLPDLDTRDTLERLQALVSRLSPKEIFVLGDSFHDNRAVARLSTKADNLLNTIVEGAERFVWILGNHDPDIPAQIKGERQASVTLGDLYLTHVPESAGSGQVNICGHLHPKAYLRLPGRRKVGAPCFAVSDTRVILPSFGAYTGGLDVTHYEVQAAMQGRAQYYCVRKDKIFHIAG